MASSPMAIRCEAVRRLIEAHRAEYEKTHATLRKKHGYPPVNSLSDLERRIAKHRELAKRLEKERRRLKTLEMQ